MSADRIEQRVRATGLLPDSGAVVVMLSGGRDSVCLVDLACRLAGPGPVSALHVNYGLRPEADADQTRCEELCAALGIELAVERVVAPRRGNLHAWARDAARLRDEAEVLDGAVDAVLRGRRHVAGAELAGLAPGLARLVLRHLAEDAAGRAAPDAAERLDELVALTAASGSAALSLHGGLRAVSEYGVLRFAAGEPPPQRAAAPVDLGVPGEAHFGAWSVRARPGPLTPRDGVLDAGALPGGLVGRPRRQG